MAVVETTKTAVRQANWADIRERSLWTGVQTALGYISAEALIAALEAAGVSIPVAVVYPLTILLASFISVVKNVIRQYLDTFENLEDIADDVEVPDVVEETPVSVEDVYPEATDEEALD